MDNIQEDPEMLHEVQPMAERLNLAPHTVITIIFVCIIVISIGVSVTVWRLHHKYDRRKRSLGFQDIEKGKEGRDNDAKDGCIDTCTQLNARSSEVDSTTVPQGSKSLEHGGSGVEVSCSKDLSDGAQLQHRPSCRV
ncbi:hypothetical protein FRC03_011847 [Tulasnella sp. 419]|nr:hypothetical protein FRC02_000136 [Tulasnella sp. 418]KAG8970048.1 hypothetical protein FRC03_011847 [Tulasnella sp. 419]